MRLIFILAFFAFTIKSFGQDSTYKNRHFLLDNSKVKVNTFYASIAPVTSWSSANNQAYNTMQLEGGLIINRKFQIGFYHIGSPNKNKVEVPEFGTEEYQQWVDAGVKVQTLDSETEFVYSYLSHAGFSFKYLHDSEKTFFPTGGVKLGILGGLKLAEKNTFFGLFNNEIYQIGVMSFTPEIGLGVNMLKWCRLHLDIGYKWVIPEESSFYITDNYSSPTFSITFNFGKYLQ